MSGQLTRPTVPALAWWAIGAFLGVIAAEALSWRRLSVGSPDLIVVAVCAATCAMAVVGLIWFRGRAGDRHLPVVIVLLLGVCVGAASGCVTWARWHAAHVCTTERAVPVRGIVERDPQPGRAGWTFPVRLADRRGVTVRVQLREGVEPPVAAERVDVRGKVRAVGLDDEWARRSHRRGEIGSVRGHDVSRVGWAATPQGLAAPIRSRFRGLLGRIDGMGGDLLQGILLGDRTRLSGTAVEQDLRVCGLSHLLAVSGTHLGILAVIMAWLAARARTGVRGRVVMVTLAALLYVVMTGVQPSSVRSLVMGAMAGLAALSGRRSDGMAALAAAAAMMLVINPYLAFDVGFRLSVLAVGGLLIFASLATRWAECALGRRGRRLATPVALTLVAQAATLPVAIPIFGVLSLVSPVANIIAVPLVTVALAVGLLGGVVGMLSAAAGIGVLTLAALPLSGVAWMARQLAMLPGAAVGLEASAAVLGMSALLLGGGLWAWWPLPRSRGQARMTASFVIAALLCAAVGLPFTPGPRLVVLDVGQGDAILVQDGRAAVLVDTGPDPDVLRTALTREGVRHLDAVILTHDHADHTGGIAGIVGLARVGRVFGPVTSDEDAFSAVRGDLGRLLAGVETSVAPEPLKMGDTFRVGGITITVLWPEKPDPSLSTNDTSVVLEVSRRGFSALLTGDAEEVVWLAMSRRGALRPVDVLKVPHHGSTNGLTAAALEAWAPEVAIISVGQPNDFAHPATATLELLESAGTTVMRTDFDGSLTVLPAEEGFAVRMRGDRRLE
ncbi:MAG: DNA internalization-related competence protein ComEC/Rec2, partial [Coriobacteriia bacterium]|nr:DNA internalization-related competence protein ComEC/Rec2 [Coriobacteriia bacterium]